LSQIYDSWFGGPLAEKRALITERLNQYEHHMTYEYIDGFEAFVRQLHRQGVKTAVVTSSNQKKMEAVYNKHSDFREMFDAILTSEDFSASKPDPDCYLKAAGLLGVSREDCVVFEDSFNGLKSGRAAGMHVIGLATTNSAESIMPLCDQVIKDYVNFEL
jgi:HAD superfamily hydrolase (TIGR01509 family)